MKYNARINFADSFDVYTELNETEPFITDVKLKDSTSLDRNITLGTSVCKQLSFTLHNAPINALDGQKVTLYIKEQPDDIEAYDMTADGYDDDTIGEAFEVEEVPEEEGNISAEALALIEADEDVSEEIYEIPIEDSEDITPVEGVDPENNVYREDEDITPVTDEDYGEVETDNYIMMGEFYITDVKESNNTYYLTALDGFILMNSPYVPTNATDTVENMYTDFINQLSQIGIVCNEEPEYPDMTITWNFSSTFREAAGYFAGLMGGYATFDRNGALDIRQYMKVEDIYVDYSGIEWSSDNSITIIGMRCDTDITAATNYLTVTSENLEGMMIEFTNPLMTLSVLENIYTTYYEYLEYTPCKVTLDWYDAIRAGDLINIDDNWILITNQTIDFGAGSSTIDSLGTTITRSEGQIENPIVRQVQRVQAKLSSNIQVATELANEASAIAEATGQHFWSQEESTYVMTHDEEVISWKTYYEYNSTTETYTKVTPVGSEIPVALMWYEVLGAGVYVTEADQESFKLTQGGMNSLWNSLGMLFRKGLTYLLSILSGGSDGTGARGIAIYDGEGNNPENVVASFTDKGSQIGKEKEAHSVIDKQSMRVIGANSDNDVTPVSYIGLLNGRATGYASLIEHPTVKVSSGADLSSVQVDLSHTVKEVSYCQTLILGEQVDLLSRTSFTDGNSFITLNLSGIGVTADTPYMLFINYSTADLIPCYSFSNKDVSVLGSLNSGAYSMMIGQDVSASGYGAFAQGWNSYASVPYAFASGVDNDVNGEGATARGRCLKIQNKGGTDQTVIGHYNSPVEDKAFVIGNGTADDSRSNAFEVGWDGNVLASGDVTDGDGNVLSDKISRSDLFFKSGDVYSVTYNHARALTGYVSSSTKGMYFEIPLPKFLTDVSSATITAMTGGVRGISGYVNGLTNGSNLKSGYTVTASVDNPNTLYVSVVSSSTLSNVTNNTPISVALNSISITFS